MCGVAGRLYGLGNMNQLAHAYGLGSYTLGTPDPFDFLDREREDYS